MLVVRSRRSIAVLWPGGWTLLVCAAGAHLVFRGRLVREVAVARG